MTPPRRVDLIAPPFSGHLHPILGIGCRLSRDGYQVRVISTESAAARIRDAGLQQHCLLEGKDDDVHAIAEPPRAVRGNPLRLNAQLRANLALLGQFQQELRALYRITPPALAIVDFTLPIAESPPIAVRALARISSAFSSDLLEPMTLSTTVPAPINASDATIVETTNLFIMPPDIL